MWTTCISLCLYTTINKNWALTIRIAFVLHTLVSRIEHVLHVSPLACTQWPTYVGCEIPTFPLEFTKWSANVGPEMQPSPAELRHWSGDLEW